jgi:glycosyltransferase involved in cell wall biosynthesis
LTAPSPPSSSSSQPGVGSPFSAEIWAEIAALRASEPELDEQIRQAEYSFTLTPALGDNAPLVRAYQQLETVLQPAAEVVFTFSWLKRGGAEWVGVQLVREAQRRYGVGAVLVLVLDWPVDEARDWLPPDTRLCVVMQAAPELTREQRASLLLHYLAASPPRLVMNCNSGITWDLLRDHGGDLAKRTRLAAFAFCFDYTEAGAPIGYPASHLPQAIPHLSRVVSDNESFKGELARTFNLPHSWLSKMVAVAQPIEMPPPPSFAPRDRDGRRPSILWASRLCRQKRPELLPELARLRPDYDFIVYGDLYEPERYSLDTFTGANLHYCGSYRTLRDLPTDTFDAFLYTALYDGLPNIVLAAGALGLPIVTAKIGGIGEVIDKTTGWPVEDHHVAAAYARALDAALADPSQTARRAQNLYQRIAANHSHDAYRNRIGEIGLFHATAAE